MHRNCTRLWLLELARSHPVGQRLLDVGITNNLKKVLAAPRGGRGGRGDREWAGCLASSKAAAFLFLSSAFECRSSGQAGSRQVGPTGRLGMWQCSAMALRAPA
eukprot:307877-Chlamydomonas_euryale.AAC.1